MSKASQRKEAERRKRMEKDLGSEGVALIKSLAKQGVDALDSPRGMLSVMGAVGPKQKEHKDNAWLHQLAVRYRPDVEAIWDTMSCWEDEMEEVSGLPMPGMVVLWNREGEMIGMASPGLFDDATVEAKPGFQGVTEWMFGLSEGAVDGQVSAVMWAFGEYTEGFPAFCLWASDTGGRVAHALVEGEWIKARVTDAFWQIGCGAAAAQARRFWKVIGKTSEGDGDGVGSAADRDANLLHNQEEARALVRKAVEESQGLYVEAVVRLVDKYRTAKESEDAAWEMQDTDAAERVVIEHQPGPKLKRLEKELSDAKGQVTRLREQMATERVALPALEVQRAIQPQRDLSERMAEFF